MFSCNACSPSWNLSCEITEVINFSCENWNCCWANTGYWKTIYIRPCLLLRFVTAIEEWELGGGIGELELGWVLNWWMGIGRWGRIGELELGLGNFAICWQHQTGIGIATQFRQKCHITKEALQIRDHALLSSAPHHAKDMLTPV